MFGLLKNNEATVKEIHDAFDSAEDRLLDKAKQIIEDHNSVDFKKGERLVQAGFVKVPEAVGLREKAQEIQDNAALADQIMHYKKTYPFLKFLTTEELENICEKYNLIYASVKYYAKDVPEKNLKDIELAQKLNRTDMLTPTMTCKLWPNNIKDSVSEVERQDLIHGRHIKYVPRQLSQADQITATWHRLTPTPMSNYTTTYTGDAGKEKLSAYDIRDFEYKDTPLSAFAYSNTMDYTIDAVDESGFFIAAPESHFELDKENMKKKGKGYLSLLKKEVDDPIVFRWVKGGLQVLTKWGLEADDPKLQVETLN